MQSFDLAPDSLNILLLLLEDFEDVLQVRTHTDFSTPLPCEIPTPNQPRLDRRRFLGISAGFGAACLLGVTADAALIEPRRPIVERTEIRLARLPREFDGLTIAHLSDFHHDSQASAEIIRRAVSVTNELRAFGRRYYEGC